MPPEQTSEQQAEPAKQRMPKRTRLLIFIVAWAILALPFLFWRSSWFGRPLSDSEITQYLHDDAHPRHIQHALVQIGERMGRARDRGVAPAAVAAPWYSDLVRLAGHPVEEVRNTDAWLMGQDPSRPEFREALHKLLADSSMNVRGNAALSLVTFGDAAGHDQVVSMLMPVKVSSPIGGAVSAVATTGEPIRNGTVLAHVQKPDGAGADVRSPITGKIASVAVQTGQSVPQGAPIAVVEPGTEQVWEALRALYLIGTKDDLPLVRSFESRGADLGERIRQQAVETEKAIVARTER